MAWFINQKTGKRKQFSDVVSKEAEMLKGYGWVSDELPEVKTPAKELPKEPVTPVVPVEAPEETPKPKGKGGRPAKPKPN